MTAAEREDRPWSSKDRQPDERFSPALLEGVRGARELLPHHGRRRTAHVEHQRAQDFFGERTVAAGFLLNAVFRDQARRLRREATIPPRERRNLARDHALATVGRLVDLDTSVWKYVIKDGVDPYRLSLEDTAAYMDKVVTPMYEVVDPSLHQWQMGFNAHDKPHAKRVADTAVLLLQQAGFGVDRQRRALIAGYGHDVGNMLGREDHALTSMKMMELTLPSLRGSRRSAQDRRQGPTDWQIVRQAIALHDSSILYNIVREQAEISLPELLSTMREDLHPETLAILLADKVDVGTTRVSPQVVLMREDAVDRDYHIRVNNEGSSEALAFTSDGRTVVWRVIYDPQKRVIEHRNPPSDFRRWVNSFERTYLERMQTFVLGSFALNKRIDRVVVQFENVDGGEAFAQSFELDNLTTGIAVLQQRALGRKPEEGIVI